jgi:hypothetical protein
MDDDFLEMRLIDPEHPRGKKLIQIALEQITIDKYKALREEKR